MIYAVPSVLYSSFVWVTGALAERMDALRSGLRYVPSEVAPAWTSDLRGKRLSDVRSILADRAAEEEWED